MKRSLALFCILSICSSITFGQAQTQPQKKAETPTAPKSKAATGTDEFSRLITEYYAAWNTMDVSAPAKYYAKEPDLIFYDIAPLQYKSWKEYQSGVAKLFQTFASFRLTPNPDLSVTRRGKVAWSTLTFHVAGKEKDGTAMDLDGRHTAIWEKRKGKWLIVHEHISIPLPQQ